MKSCFLHSLFALGKVIEKNMAREPLHLPFSSSFFGFFFLSFDSGLKGENMTPIEINAERDPAQLLSLLFPRIF